MSDIQIDSIIPAPRLAEQLGITRRTLARWLDNSELAFPTPARINGRLYFSRGAIEVWKTKRLQHAGSAGVQHKSAVPNHSQKATK
jgi:predicted DNA-binding transcriptional regulator AlpA